jgi:hypothetical protein
MRGAHPTQVEPDLFTAGRQGGGWAVVATGTEGNKPGRFEKSSFCLAISTGIHRQEILFAGKFRIIRIVYTP